MRDYIELKRHDLSVQEVTELVNAADCGAISLFVGTTRNNMAGKPVSRLEYEAFESMALKELLKICNQMRERYASIRNIAIHHRIGEVEVKKSSVIIAVSSPHRKDAMAATAYCIDQIKTTVPIFKKVGNINTVLYFREI